MGLFLLIRSNAKSSLTASHRNYITVFGISLDNVCFPLVPSWISHGTLEPIKSSPIYYSQQHIICIREEKIKRIEYFKCHLFHKQGVDYILHFWKL